MSVLIVAEHNNQSLTAATYNTVTAGLQLSEQVTLLVAGHNAQSVADEAASLAGVTEVIYSDADCFSHPIAEQLAKVVSELGRDFGFVLAPASTFGKNLLPRVAALLDVAQISDILEVVDQNTFKRPIYAGNAIATVQSGDAIKVISVRPTAFDAVQKSDSQAAIRTLEATANGQSAQFVSQALTKSERPELSSAKRVVSGGRALKSEENFKLIDTLAEKLGAAVGASRAAVDAGFVPNDYQVGQTGKVVAPELYLAIGISGAIQHLAGMKDSKVIVAINKDPDAPIFQVADYGLVGDLFEIVPELTEKL